MTAPLMLLASAAQGWAVPPPPADVLGNLVPPPAIRAAADYDSLWRWSLHDRCRIVEEGEIVVCRGREAERIQFPPIPGERVRLIAGEPPGAAAALGAGGGCERLCHDPVGITIDPVRLVRDPLGALRAALRGRR